HVRLREVAVELGNLIFEHQVIAERVPGQFPEQAMILVAILTAVGQHHIRGNPAAQRFQSLLDFGEEGRKVAIAEFAHFEIQLRRWAQKRPPRRPGFLGPRSARRKDRPYEAGVRVALRPGSKGSTASDLDVVAVSPDAEDCLGVRELQTGHHQPQLPWLLVVLVLDGGVAHERPNRVTAAWPQARWIPATHDTRWSHARRRQ